MRPQPEIKDEMFALMWCESEDGERRAEIDLVGSVSWPDVQEFPVSVNVDVSVRTEYYKRRMADGGYGGDDLITTFSSGFSEDLALAMATGANGQKRYRLLHAIIIAAKSCEGCMNILAHRYGLPWGYSADSDEARRVGTFCKMCRPSVD